MINIKDNNISFLILSLKNYFKINSVNTKRHINSKELSG